MTPDTLKNCPTCRKIECECPKTIGKIMPPQNTKTVEEIVQEFAFRAHNDSETREFTQGCYECGQEIDVDGIANFLHTLLLSERLQAEEAIALAVKEDRQFILNILDGIDIADKEMGKLQGGTLAIRFALATRITPKQ